MAILILEEAADAILSLPTREQQKSFSRALRDSVKITLKNSPTGVTAASLTKTHRNLTPKSMRDHGILLGKDAAITLLSQTGNLVGGAGFKKRLSANRYRQAFGVGAVKVSRALLFTYSDILIFEGATDTLELPDAIIKVLS